MRLTPRGWTFLILGLAWTAGALAIGERDAIWPGLFLALLPVVSLLGLIPALAVTHLERQLPVGLTQAGDPASLILTVETPGLLPGCRGELTEELPPSVGGSWEFNFTLEARRRVFQLSAQVLPHWRGRHLVGPASLRVIHPFELARVQRDLPGQSTLVVIPRVCPLPRIRDLDGGSSGIQTPVTRVGSLGVDDALIREYRSGDDTRRIHWRSSARHGELMVRREEHAWDPAAVMLIDSRRLAYQSETNDLRFEAAVSLAASIGSHLFAEGWGLTLADSSGELADWTGSGHEREREFLLWLTDLEQSSVTALSQLPDVFSSELLVAVIGRLSTADAAELAAVRRDRRHCWAVVIEGAEAIADDALSVLRDSGWKVQPIPADTPADRAWQSFETSQR
ncbi:MAG: DUF58 domain-containing protein [Propionibacteriaceae bacterium]|jgi:uncharacterized protein (DUF58 family)|nr:DUF58 domain-containing protein [Propionibacteriaceae bacterium]